MCPYTDSLAHNHLDLGSLNRPLCLYAPNTVQSAQLYEIQAPFHSDTAEEEKPWSWGEEWLWSVVAPLKKAIRRLSTCLHMHASDRCWIIHPERRTTCSCIWVMGVHGFSPCLNSCSQNCRHYFTGRTGQSKSRTLCITDPTERHNKMWKMELQKALVQNYNTALVELGAVEPGGWFDFWEAHFWRSLREFCTLQKIFFFFCWV